MNGNKLYNALYNYENLLHDTVMIFRRYSEMTTYEIEEPHPRHKCGILDGNVIFTGKKNIEEPNHRGINYEGISKGQLREPTDKRYAFSKFEGFDAWGKEFLERWGVNEQ